MREIKFRAYIKEVNKNYPCCVSQHRTDDWSNIAFVEWRDYVDWFNCNIMQYTWLKDKNWKEIYEGDIIQFNWYSVNYKWCIKYGLYNIYTNWWMSFIWETIWRYISDKNWKILIDDSQETILLTYRLTPIIIWNIYENQELLK